VAGLDLARPHSRLKARPASGSAIDFREPETIAKFRNLNNAGVVTERLKTQGEQERALVDGGDVAPHITAEDSGPNDGIPPVKNRNTDPSEHQAQLNPWVQIFPDDVTRLDKVEGVHTDLSADVPNAARDDLDHIIRAEVDSQDEPEVPEAEGGWARDNDAGGEDSRSAELRWRRGTTVPRIMDESLVDVREEPLDSVISEGPIGDKSACGNNTV
jgi:hypothetical protein